MSKILITEERFNLILTEELGIADKVIKITELIENKIDKLLLQKILLIQILLLSL